MLSRITLVLALIGCGASSPPPQTPGPLVATPAMADQIARAIVVDPDRGLVVVAHLEDQPQLDDSPSEYTTGHFCAADEIREIGSRLAEDIARRAPDSAGWSCGDDWCEVTGEGEYDPMHALQLGRDASGRTVLIAFSLFDQPGVPDEVVDSFRTRGRQEASALVGSCP